MAYRAVYRQNKGPIAEGYEIHHKCECCECVNWRHLYALSKEDHIEAHRLIREKGTFLAEQWCKWAEKTNIEERERQAEARRRQEAERIRLQKEQWDRLQKEAEDAKRRAEEAKRQAREKRRLERQASFENILNAGKCAGAFLLLIVGIACIINAMCEAGRPEKPLHKEPSVLSTPTPVPDVSATRTESRIDATKSLFSRNYAVRWHGTLNGSVKAVYDDRVLIQWKNSPKLMTYSFERLADWLDGREVEITQKFEYGHL
jgi:hypothetical protein